MEDFLFVYNCITKLYRSGIRWNMIIAFSILYGFFSIYFNVQPQVHLLLVLNECVNESGMEKSD